MPGERFEIASVAGLKALADPTRLEVLERLEQSPSTAKQLAAAMGAPPNRVYYHLKVLADHGLVKVDGTGDARRYEVAATEFAVARSVPWPGGAAAALAQVSAAAKGQAAMVMRVRLALTPEQRDELAQRLRALLAEFEGPAGPQAADHSIVVSLYESGADT